jgi:hypothetical protein
MRPAKNGGVHEVSLRLVVHSDTPSEAIYRVLSHFPRSQWPEASIKIDKVRRVAGESHLPHIGDY